MPAQRDMLPLEDGLLSGTRKNLPSFRYQWISRTTTVLLCSIAVLAYLLSHIRARFLLTGAWDQQQVIGRLYSSAWAQYAPYRPVTAYADPPEGCIITQANIRHGARFPTEGAERRILKALDKLLSAAPYRNPRLEFLNQYTYSLGTDVMVPYGAEEVFESGEEAYRRYWSLVNTSESGLPFIRSDASQRDVDSALNWTAGFSAASRHQLYPQVSLVMDGTARNNTLDGSQCPAAGRGEQQTFQWLATHYTKITAQLNTDAPGAELSNEDTYNLMTLCPFETLAHRSKSPWCKLFESIHGAFDGFEYSGDLDKFYKTGYGQPLGPVQGVGYSNELLARLTESPVQDHTQTNHSLDDVASTFPLNRTLFVDFSHDNQMIAIFSAMGLFRQDEPLDPTKPDPSRTWRVSTMVPFAGRMVVERLDCSRAGASVTFRKMVRILVQDKIQPLGFCGADKDGMCTLEAFVSSQAYARNNGEGDWERCFELSGSR